jgi:hypothetical protein
VNKHHSMRIQLLIQIEQFDGVVVFATNLAQNYDGTFVTRIRSIHFKKPDEIMYKMRPLLPGVKKCFGSNRIQQRGRCM